MSTNIPDELIDPISNWKRIVTNYGTSEDFIYEWLNDLDGRHIITKLLVQLPNTERQEIEKLLAPIDEEFKRKTFEKPMNAFGLKKNMTETHIGTTIV